MRKFVLFFIFMFLTVNVHAQRITSMRAGKVKTSTTDFGNILSSTDNDVQDALDTLDDAITSSNPTDPTDTCTKGRTAYADGFWYVCIDTDTWQRVAIATWSVSTFFILLSDGSSKILLSDGSSFLIGR